ncbi:Uncharacterized protein TCM_045948 [Theobroma cacao]|uniref:Uncharacterized protein n=1 Tax=Theobroma cacao TaxID=3641 RepID=S1S3U8_THECC|nr:Uncharacterized protein TCM_045948 [Theobroma cacao]
MYHGVRFRPVNGARRCGGVTEHGGVSLGYEPPWGVLVRRKLMAGQILGINTLSFTQILSSSLPLSSILFAACVLAGLRPFPACRCECALSKVLVRVLCACQPNTLCWVRAVCAGCVLPVLSAGEGCALGAESFVWAGQVKGKPKAARLGRLQNPHVTGCIRAISSEPGSAAGSVASQAVCWDSGRDKLCYWVYCKPSSVVGEPVPKGKETRASQRGRYYSQDLISALDVRVSRVEVAVGDMRDRLDVQEEHRELEDLRAEVHVARAEGGSEAAARPEVRLEVPKPKEFRDRRDAKEIDNFLWGLKQYFKVTEINTDDRRITAASMYLGDTALLWWRHRCDDRLGGAPADKGKQSRDEDDGNGKPQSPWNGNSTWKGKPSGSKEDKPKSYFLCEGPHFVRDYPKRVKLVAIASEEEEQQEDEAVRLGSMQLGVVCKGCKRAKGLMYADMVVAGQQVEALVDTGASDLFVSEQGAAKLGLKADSTGGWVKTVNSKWVRTKGIAKGIDVQLGKWHGTKDIEVIQMDDYEVLMGLNFLERIQALLVPHNDCMCIVGSKGQCIVPVRLGCAQPTKTLSAIQLIEGEQICAAVRSLEDTPSSIVEASDEVLEVSEHQPGGANPVAGEPSREATPPASKKARVVHVSDGLGRAKVNRPHEPQHEGLRKLPLKECHDICGAGHSRIHRTPVSHPPFTGRAGSRESSMTRRRSATARPHGGRPMPDGAAQQNIDTRARGMVCRNESAQGQESRRGTTRMSVQLKHLRARPALKMAKGPRVSEGSDGEVPAKDPGRLAPPSEKVSSVRQEGFPHMPTFHPTKVERTEGPKGVQHNRGPNFECDNKGLSDPSSGMRKRRRVGLGGTETPWAHQWAKSACKQPEWSCQQSGSVGRTDGQRGARRPRQAYRQCQGRMKDTNRSRRTSQSPHEVERELPEGEPKWWPFPACRCECALFRVLVRVLCACQPNTLYWVRAVCASCVLLMLSAGEGCTLGAESFVWASWFGGQVKGEPKAARLGRLQNPHVTDGPRCTVPSTFACAVTSKSFTPVTLCLCSCLLCAYVEDSARSFSACIISSFSLASFPLFSCIPFSGKKSCVSLPADRDIAVISILLFASDFLATTASGPTTLTAVTFKGSESIALMGSCRLVPDVCTPLPASVDAPMCHSLLWLVSSPYPSHPYHCLLSPISHTSWTKVCRLASPATAGALESSLSPSVLGSVDTLSFLVFLACPCTLCR